MGSKHQDTDTDASSPDISVIVPTRNRPAMLAEALFSISAQDWSSWECIVVDDGSEPSVTLPLDDERFSLIRRDNPGGPAAARNTGIRSAKGRYVTFLDDDDLMAPGRFRLAITALKADPGKNCHVGTLLRTHEPRITQSPIKGQGVNDKQLRTGTPSVEMLMLERALVAPFDEALRVGEDVDWWLRIEPDVRPVITNDVVSIVRLHDAQGTGVSDEVRFASRKHTYLKNRTNMPLIGAVRSRHQRRLAESALASGRPWTAALYATLSLLTRPSLRKAKLATHSVTRGLSIAFRSLTSD